MTKPDAERVFTAYVADTKKEDKKYARVRLIACLKHHIIETGSARRTKSRLCASKFPRVKPPKTARSAYRGVLFFFFVHKTAQKTKMELLRIATDADKT